MKRGGIKFEQVSWLTGIAVAGLAIGLGVGATRGDRRLAGHPEDHATVALTIPEGTDDTRREASHVDDARDFRLLLTILTGVALGAATVALPPLLEAPKSYYWTTVS